MREDIEGTRVTWPRAFNSLALPHLLFKDGSASGAGLTGQQLPAAAHGKHRPVTGTKPSQRVPRVHRAFLCKKTQLWRTKISSLAVAGRASVMLAISTLAHQCLVNAYRVPPWHWNTSCFLLGLLRSSTAELGSGCRGG